MPYITAKWLFIYITSLPHSWMCLSEGQLNHSCLFRIINVIGDPIDERGPINTDKRQPIHAEAPEFVEMSVEQEILVTGIKVMTGPET